jgi:hypothetical protein
VCKVATTSVLRVGKTFTFANPEATSQRQAHPLELKSGQVEP